MNTQTLSATELVPGMTVVERDSRGQLRTTKLGKRFTTGSRIQWQPIAFTTDSNHHVVYDWCASVQIKI